MQLTIAKSSKKKTDTSGNQRSSVEERRKEHHNSEARLGRRILKVSTQHHKTKKHIYEMNTKDLPQVQDGTEQCVFKVTHKCIARNAKKKKSVKQ